jgi:hypothetical protein
VIRDRRTLAYIVIAIIVGAALAFAVALSNGHDSATPTAPGQVQQAAAVSQSDILGSDQGATDVAVADPARTEVVLDQFSAKDPFIPLATASPSPSGSATPTPSPTASTSYQARVSVNGTEYTVSTGDKVPTGSPAFKISSITSGDVTFTVIDGKLKNGDSSITVNLGESVKATLESGTSYNLSVVSIGQGSGGGSSNGSTGGHSISVLSITTSNGTAMCALEVDGKTYSDLKVGDVVKTSWGEIAIVSINVSSQTVTVMHGDQTLVLHAGQVVVK